MILRLADEVCKGFGKAGDGKAELALFWTDCCGALAQKILNLSP
jgi:hypothetical protein